MTHGDAARIVTAGTWAEFRFNEKTKAAQIKAKKAADNSTSKASRAAADAVLEAMVESGSWPRVISLGRDCLASERCRGAFGTD
jgi:hypothetical protein